MHMSFYRQAVPSPDLTLFHICRAQDGKHGDASGIFTWKGEALQFSGGLRKHTDGTSPQGCFEEVGHASRKPCMDATSQLHNCLECRHSAACAAQEGQRCPEEGVEDSASRRVTELGHQKEAQPREANGSCRGRGIKTEW